MEQNTILESPISFMLERFSASATSTAVIWQEQDYTYQWLLTEIEKARNFFKVHSIEYGSIVALRSDFNPTSIAFVLASLERGIILVPVSYTVKTFEEFCDIAEVEHIIEVTSDSITHEKRSQSVLHEIMLGLKAKRHPGLVLFSSGTTGKPKAAVHDFIPLLEKFKVKRHTLRTITFLLFDHIGGVNTLLYILSNTGTIVAIEDRSPENVCRLIEKYNVELLPTSPSFISLLLVSRAYERYNITSLKMMTYGTEAMPESTLQRVHELFPAIEMKQTYGLSELGIMRSQSRGNNSLWVRIGGEDYQTKIVDDVLFIKAKSAMLGYLNAPSPFDAEGWFNTQDRVEVDGEWMKILGRTSDIINVGGQKVYPIEVESVLLQMEGINDVAVYGKDNPLLGKVVAVDVVLENEESLPMFKNRMRSFCNQKLERYKIPVEVSITSESHISSRYKKMRPRA